MGLTRRPHLGRLLPGGHDVVPGNTHTLRVLSSSFGPVFYCYTVGGMARQSIIRSFRRQERSQNWMAAGVDSNSRLSFPVNLCFIAAEIDIFMSHG
jgi:hypothetical protein